MARKLIVEIVGDQPLVRTRHGPLHEGVEAVRHLGHGDDQVGLAGVRNPAQGGGGNHWASLRG